MLYTVHDTRWSYRLSNGCNASPGPLDRKGGNTREGEVDTVVGVVAHDEAVVEQVFIVGLIPVGLEHLASKQPQPIPQGLRVDKAMHKQRVRHAVAPSPSNGCVLLLHPLAPSPVCASCCTLLLHRLERYARPLALIKETPLALSLTEALRHWTPRLHARISRPLRTSLFAFSHKRRTRACTNACPPVDGHAFVLDACMRLCWMLACVCVGCLHAFVLDACMRLCWMLAKAVHTWK
jgi:hypothetical protein